MINKKILTDRNRKLRHLFIRIYSTFEDQKIFIRLVGGMDKPRILVGEENIIEGYLDNNTFVLTDGENELMKIPLKDNADHYDRLTLSEVYNYIVLKKIFKLRFGDSILFLTGFKYFNSEKTLDNGYPIFSKYNPKIFYDMEYAEKILKKLEKFGYPVNIE